MIQSNEDDHYQTRRIIQWLDNERAVDVPHVFNHSPLSKDDLVNDQIVSSPCECHSSSLSKYSPPTFERACLHRRKHCLADAQTSEEAYYTISSAQCVQTSTDLIRRESTSGYSSLSSRTPMDTSLSADENEPTHLPHLDDDRSMDLFREIMRHGEHSERDFQEMVEEFLQLIESKLSDTETKLFESHSTRATSPSLFDLLNDLKTCLTLLRRTEIQSLLNVFDRVLKLHSDPSAALPPTKANEELSKLSQYAIDELKIVNIEKTHEPLGLTITRSESGMISIARVIVGGLAANSALFQIDDRILEINDQPITGQSLDSICTIMANSTGSMKFLLSPPINPHYISYQTFHVRALYTYDPFTDPLLPCKELGLAFQRADILRIVARDENLLKMNDSYVSWWQAYRENPDQSIDLAGLIPSDSLQQKRSDFLRMVSDESDSLKSFDQTKRFLTCGTSRRERKGFSNEKQIPTIRTSINHFSLTDTRQFDNEKSSTILKKLAKNSQEITNDLFRFYEPVFQLDLASAKRTRPIVLLGAPNVGRHEIRRRLLQNDFPLFDIAIPHTTRARRLEETPDVDYHFVSEADFLAQVACHSFIEFGQYERDLYGTSVDDIRHVVEMKHQICILNLNPDAIRMFDRTNLYPYVICIAAPSFERLKRLELDRRETLTEKDYRDILRQSRTIERRYRLLFDQVLVNQDVDRTCAELRELILKIQAENRPWIRSCYRKGE